MALVLQLFIAAFSSFLLVGLVNLYDPSQAQSRVVSHIAYVGPGGFADLLQNASGLEVTVVEQAQAKQLFDQGRVDAVVEELYNQPDQVRTVNLLLPQGELRTTFLVTVLKDHLKAYEKELRGERADQIQTQIVYVQTETKTASYYAFSYSLLVPLLLIVPVFLSGAIAADAVTQEIETRTLDLLRASPAGAKGIFLGKSIAPIVLAPLQGLLWILLFRLNGIVVQNALLVLFLLTGLTVILVAASVFTALVLRKQGDAQIAYSLLVLLLFGLSYLLPQPILATFARLAVGSATLVELGTIGGVVFVGAFLLALGSALAPRLIDRIP